MIEVVTPDLEPAFDRAMNEARWGEPAAKMQAAD